MEENAILVSAASKHEKRLLPRVPRDFELPEQLTNPVPRQIDLCKVGPDRFWDPLALADRVDEASAEVHWVSPGAEVTEHGADEFGHIEVSGDGRAVPGIWALGRTKRRA